ncbi:urea ABC transporter permease subunit UrtC [Microbulbifer hydrolyticus]|uniref:Urea ABC transporter permease subunit UrtC n=1 Tax=Microbulbifer hydrolyticus TaxID=48074 RepID=A0A6P1T5M4_9GAMM|nr:urea ABC transporter permease subunit UrtC [Microbulbifer hydrolyticus]MBB5211086.1 urea transport system permease protein [Microbulbifer hydrolyticus]QHQ38124.1 urea ABC transporter permease subunit UrtC [Microbulbifer hydrolyticus]
MSVTNPVWEKIGSALTELRQPGKGSSALVGILLVTTLGMSAANLLLPADSPLYVSTYTITLMGKYLCFAMLAMAVDIIWGYCGILSLGHGAFFALGGYGMGMYLMRQIGDRGVYGNPDLPDFMVFLNWQELPWYWFGMDQFWFAVVMALAVPGLLAFVFGWLAFRSRVTGVYLSIMTQALTYALMLAFFRNEMGFGGNNGLTDFKDILGFDLQVDATRVALLLVTTLLLVITFITSRAIVQSRLGRVIVAVRDAEARARFLGYRTERYKVWLFVYSALIAAVAGMLYVPQVGIINPGEFSPLNSIEVVVWVAVGGRGTLYGAIVGALLVNYAKTRFTAIMPDGWLFALGALFVIVTVYLPKGLAGLLQRFGSEETAQPARRNAGADTDGGVRAREANA